MKYSNLKEREIGRAIGVIQMAKIAIAVFDKLDRETPFKLPMWAYRVLREALGKAEDYLDSIERKGKDGNNDDTDCRGDMDNSPRDGDRWGLSCEEDRRTRSA